MPDPALRRARRGPDDLGLPRDDSGGAFLSARRRLGYERVRQRGLHVCVTTREGGEHHEVTPLHDPTRAMTLSSTLKSVAGNHAVGVPELLLKFGLP